MTETTSEFRRLSAAPRVVERVLLRLAHARRRDVGHAGLAAGLYVTVMHPTTAYRLGELTTDGVLVGAAAPALVTVQSSGG